MAYKALGNCDGHLMKYITSCSETTHRHANGNLYSTARQHTRQSEGAGRVHVSPALRVKLGYTYQK